MEENIKPIQPEKATGKLKKIIISFFMAIFLSVIFFIVCIPFLINTKFLPTAEVSLAGQLNMWRIVIIFGILTAITTAFQILRRRNRLAVLFLWIFWIIIGILFVYIIYNRGGQIYISSNAVISEAPLMGISGSLPFISYILPYAVYVVWFIGIYYCVKFAKLLGRNGSNAILLGLFLPVLSAFYYSYLLFKKIKKEAKVKVLKIISGVIIFLAFISVGLFYYAIGTPQYSLYKFKKAIQNNNDADLEKYLAIDEISVNIGATRQQLKNDLKSLDVSILEIMEENPDHGKTASKYIPTELTGKNVESVAIQYDSSKQPVISIKFNPEGKALLSKITRENLGKSIAIFLNEVLVSSPIVQEEITNGEAIISGITFDQAKMYAEKIKEGKDSMLNCLKIMSVKTDRDSASLTIRTIGDGTSEINMVKTQGRYWKIVKADILYDSTFVILPTPEEAKTSVFSWKYKGKNYSIEQTLYGSFYETYKSLPAETFDNGESAVGWQEKNNDMFLNGAQDDSTIQNLANSLNDLGSKNNLSYNQLAEMVASFVQTIPYDTEKFNNRQAGLSGIAEKPTYPYEVLYEDKGVCQDKSYLAYMLLKNLGYGVSIFIFPEDHHMAVGIKCPIEYSSYNSGYCFLETTSLGNKIGIIPDLTAKNNIATSNVEVSAFGVDQDENQYNPLGKFEMLNAIDGESYTGIIETIATQKEIAGLRASLNSQNSVLKSLTSRLKSEESDLKDMEGKLKSLYKKESYNTYKDYYSKYSKAFSKYKGDIKDYNNKVAIYNQTSNKYNKLLKIFYQ